MFSLLNKDWINHCCSFLNDIPDVCKVSRINRHWHASVGKIGFSNATLRWCRSKSLGPLTMDYMRWFKTQMDFLIKNAINFPWYKFLHHIEVFTTIECPECFSPNQACKCECVFWFPIGTLLSFLVSAPCLVSIRGNDEIIKAASKANLRQLKWVDFPSHQQVQIQNFLKKYSEQLEIVQCISIKPPDGEAYYQFTNLKQLKVLDHWTNWNQLASKFPTLREISLVDLGDDSLNFVNQVKTLKIVRCLLPYTQPLSKVVIEDLNSITIPRHIEQFHLEIKLVKFREGGIVSQDLFDYLSKYQPKDSRVIYSFNFVLESFPLYFQDPKPMRCISKVRLQLIKPCSENEQEQTLIALGHYFPHLTALEFALSQCDCLLSTDTIQSFRKRVPFLESLVIQSKNQVPQTYSVEQTTRRSKNGNSCVYLVRFFKFVVVISLLLLVLMLGLRFSSSSSS